MHQSIDGEPGLIRASHAQTMRAPVRKHDLQDITKEICFTTPASPGCCTRPPETEKLPALQARHGPPQCRCAGL